MVKFFVVESFNAYFSLFYIAFVKENIPLTNAENSVMSRSPDASTSYLGSGSGWVWVQLGLGFGLVALPWVRVRVRLFAPALVEQLH